MPIDVFDKATFEEALPVMRRESDPPIETKLWKPLGLIDGEYAYLLPVREPFSIMIRSSVHPDGQAAATGEDSIRCWIVDGNRKPYGSKVSKYITRVPGWRERLIRALRKLYKMTLLIDKCEHCGQYRKIFKVKKDGPNKGKVFLKCTNCQRDANRPPEFIEI